MGERLRKFMPRAPRYVLRPQDRSAMRFSLEHTGHKGEIQKTLLVNLSETGVAFLIERGQEPHLGERIKVEIPIPGEDQIAWWGRVARIQEHEAGSRWMFSTSHNEIEEDMVLVGVRFEALPTPHSRAIRRGIEKSFMQAMRDQHYRTWLYYRALFMQNVFKATALVLFAIAAFAFMYWISLPGENYDSKRGAPWGERFKF